MNIFAIYESLLLNVMKILPTIYENKTKVPGKIRKFRAYLQGNVSSINRAQAIFLNIEYMQNDSRH